MQVHEGSSPFFRTIKNSATFVAGSLIFIDKGLETNSDLTDEVASNREKGPVDLLIAEKKVPSSAPLKTQQHLLLGL